LNARLEGAGSLTDHRLSAAIEDVGGHHEDQGREDARQRVFAVRQPIGQRHAGEPAHDAAGDELAGDPPIDQTGQRVVCTENLIRVDEVMESPKLAE
jgi:hypothetical protein